MVRINWTNRSRNDLEQILEYVSRDSSKYAKIQVFRIYKKVELLMQFPLAGKVVSELNDRAIREIVEGNYRIIYRIVNSERIDILAVHHGARSLESRGID